MENTDLTAKDNIYDWQKETNNKSEKYKIIAGYDIDTYPSNI